MAKLRSKATFEIGQTVKASLSDPLDPATETAWDTVSNRTTITGPEATKSDIENTDMDSTSKEYFGDLPDNGSINISGNRNFGNAGQAAARTQAGSNLTRAMRVQWLDPSDDSVQETAVFFGEIMEWSVDASQGSANTFTTRAKITGDVTYS